MSSQAQQRRPQQQHRRDVLLGIVLPIVGIAGLTVFAVILVLRAASPVQFSLVANALLTVFILCPTVLTCLIPTILFMAAAIGLGELNNRAAPPLARGRNAVIRLLESASAQAPRLASPVVKMQSRLNYWERLLAGRPKPVEPSPHEEHTHGS